MKKKRFRAALSAALLTATIVAVGITFGGADRSAVLDETTATKISDDAEHGIAITSRLREQRESQPSGATAAPAERAKLETELVLVEAENAELAQQTSTLLAEVREVAEQNPAILEPEKVVEQLILPELQSDVAEESAAAELKEQEPQAPEATAEAKLQPQNLNDDELAHAVGLLKLQRSALKSDVQTLEIAKEALENIEAEPENRTDCGAVQGTEYRSKEERSWFLDQCTFRTNCAEVEGTAYRNTQERVWFLKHCVATAGTGVIAGSGTPSSNRDAGQQMAAAQGWGGEQWPCLDTLWSIESGWRTDAQNPGSGAYGIPQALPASKMASAGADWATNPKTQIAWGLNYIAAAYGSPCAALQFLYLNSWY